MNGIFWSKPLKEIATSRATTMFLFLEPFQARVFSLTRFLLENRSEVRQKYSALVNR